MAKNLALLVATAVFLVPTGSPAQAAPDNFNPRSGPTFNSPLGDTGAKRAIFRKIIRSVNSTPRGSEIKFFTWNFLTREGASALLRAQERGVRVRLLMDRSNNTEIVNQPFRRLRAGLHRGNKRPSANRPSWARVCDHSCRGKTGAAHSKYFLFSKVGKVERVVMHGSANLTLASTNNQWNDIYTHTGSRAVWQYANAAFAEAVRDQPAARPYLNQNFGGFRLMMFPLTGPGSSDPVLGLLNRVKCRGATNTANHRTRIRIAPDVIRKDRGMVLARKVRQLWNDGCDVQIGYTVMGVEVGRMLRSSGGRGPVPMRHLVQDFDGDGAFDNYFHLKAMTIVGNVRGDRSGYALLNGSANWSSLAKVSDENLGIYYSKRRTLQYQKHLEYWYNNFPQSARPKPLMFGTGRKSVYEGGSRVPSGIDPYEHVDMD